MLLSVVVSAEKGTPPYIVLSIVNVEPVYARHFMEGSQKAISLNSLQCKEATNRCRSRDGRQSSANG